MKFCKKVILCGKVMTKRIPFAYRRVVMLILLVVLTSVHFILLTDTILVPNILNSDLDDTIYLHDDDHDHDDDGEHSASPSSSLIINPFRDIKLSPSKSHSNLHSHSLETEEIKYSTSMCISAVNQEIFRIAKSRFVSRTCKFRNLYYTPHDQTFHYYPSPEENELFQDNGYYEEFKRRITTSLGNVYQYDAHDIDKVPSFTKWHPVVHRYKRQRKSQSQTKVSNAAEDIMTTIKPPEQYAVISNPANIIMLLYHPFHSFKIGHLIWDDLLSLFSMLDAFGMTGIDDKDDGDNQNKTFHMPFYLETGDGNDPYFRCVATTENDNLQLRWPECTKTYHKFYPDLLRYQTHATGDIIRSGNWLQGMESVHGGAKKWNNSEERKIENNDYNHEKNWNKMLPNTTHVLIPTLLSGTGRLGQMSCDGDCAINRSSQLWSFRTYLLRNIFLSNYKLIHETHQNKMKKLRQTNHQHHQHHQQLQSMGLITFSLPGGSSRPEQISNFENIIPIAKELYGEDRVKVVDMAKLTFQEEALLAMDTAILFANHGSGSLTSIFCERGAAIFLYASDVCKGRPNTIWCDHGRNHFDSVFYESAAYIRPVWIEEEDRNNTAKIKNLMQLEMRKTLDVWFNQ